MLVYMCINTYEIFLNANLCLISRYFVGKQDMGTGTGTVPSHEILRAEQLLKT